MCSYRCFLKLWAEETSLLKNFILFTTHYEQHLIYKHLKIFNQDHIYSIRIEALKKKMTLLEPDRYLFNSISNLFMLSSVEGDFRNLISMLQACYLINFYIFL
jgi:hypothetical protein